MAKNTKGQIHPALLNRVHRHFSWHKITFENICSSVLDWPLNTCSIVETLKRLLGDKTQNKIKGFLVQAAMCVYI